MVILNYGSSTDFPEKIVGIPENYNFEIPKILKTIEKTNSKKITLQFPDGLLAYAPLIIDTIQTYFPNAECVIMNDVVYGACCVDDQSLKSDLLIHFGHSCLVPITEMETRTLYIFVDIKIDVQHLYELIIQNFNDKVAIIGTIQFNSSVNKLKRLLDIKNREACSCKNQRESHFPDDNSLERSVINTDLNKLNVDSSSRKEVIHKEQTQDSFEITGSADLKEIEKNLPSAGTQESVKSEQSLSIANSESFLTMKAHNSDIHNSSLPNSFRLEKLNINNSAHSLCECKCVKPIVPQIKPLSPGEVLGCTSPVISGVKDVIYIGDGRFHLESAMIRNPNLNFFKYCPFTKKITREYYDFNKMKQLREKEIKKALEGKSFGVILGSLGRQGNRKIFDNVVKKLQSIGKYKIYKIIVDEINQEILKNFPFIDSFVQISCPRLSIYWGANYSKPLLSPFELFYENDYKMDYYSSEGSAPWKNYNNDY